MHVLSWFRVQTGTFLPRYDASYRISANFLNWVSVNYDSNIVTELNADLRQRKYTGDFWKRHTGKTVQELGDKWKQQMKPIAPRGCGQPRLELISALRHHTLVASEDRLTVATRR